MSAQCNPCGRTFKDTEAFHQHLRDSPKHAVTHDCDKCDRSFTTKQALDQHLRHSTKHNVAHGRDQCERSFTTKQRLDQHLRGTSSRSTTVRSFDIRPSLHDDVARLLEEFDLIFDFHGTDEAHEAVQEYDSHITGRFACKKASCLAKGWSSKKIAITIRMYPNARYNARVYYQRCKICNSLSRPTLNDTYGERVAYRLEKWCGIKVQTPYFSKQSKGPHEKHLCEGCKNGRCSDQVAME